MSLPRCVLFLVWTHVDDFHIKASRRSMEFQAFNGRFTRRDGGAATVHQFSASSFIEIGAMVLGLEGGVDVMRVALFVALLVRRH